MGLTKEEFAGKSDYEIFPKEEADFFKIRDAMVFRNNRAFKNEETMSYPNGQKRTFEVHKAPFHDDQGNILGLVGISRDITDRLKERKEIEEARTRQQSMSQQQAEAMTRLSEQLGHILDGSDYKPANNEIAPADFTRIRMLVEGLNSFIRTIFRNPVLSNKGTDPEILFIKLEKRIEEALADRDIRISFTSPPELPEIVFVDDSRLIRTIYFFINILTLDNPEGTLSISNQCVEKLLITSISLKADSIHDSTMGLIDRLIRKEPGRFYPTEKETPIEITMAEIELEMLKSTVKLSRREKSFIQLEITTPFPHGIEYLNQYYAPKNEFS